MTVFERLLKETRDRKAQSELLLLQGNFANWESYRYEVGRLKGIEEVLGIIKEILKGI